MSLGARNRFAHVLYVFACLAAAQPALAQDPVGPEESFLVEAGQPGGTESREVTLAKSDKNGNGTVSVRVSFLPNGDVKDYEVECKVTELPTPPLPLAAFTARDKDQAGEPIIICERDVHRAEVLTAVVTKKKADGKVETTWTRKLTVLGKANWEVMYGFMFTSDQSEHWFGKAEEVTIPPADPVTQYRVTRESDRRSLQFVPSVLFNYTPRKWAEKPVAPGLMAGLGFDLEKPVVLVGGSFTTNRNVSLVVGALIHEQTRLHGRYEPGELLLEDLDDDQLDEGSYKPTWFAGVAFKFDSAPFKKSTGGN